MGDENVVVDLTGFKDRVGQYVPPGRYRVLVEEAESDTSKQGNPMVVLYLRVQGGEHDGSNLVDRLTLTDKAMFRVVNFMQAIGMPTPRKRLQINLRQFTNRVLDVDVQDEPYLGKVTAKIAGYNKASDSGKPKADLPDADEAAPDDLTGLDEFTKDTAVTDADVPDEVDLDKIDLG
jgi:hypothetical protein